MPEPQIEWHDSELEVSARIIKLALVLNAIMFVVGTDAGLLARSSALIADALDMFADACSYAIALAAFGRSATFKRNAALSSGAILLVLGAGVLLDAVRRVWFGASPDGVILTDIRRYEVERHDANAGWLQMFFKIKTGRHPRDVLPPFAPQSTMRTNSFKRSRFAGKCKRTLRWRAAGF